jgi:hypothetical protein
VCCFDARRFEALAQVTPDNEQSGATSPDVIGILHRQGHRLEAVVTDDRASASASTTWLAELAGIMRRHPRSTHAGRVT